MEPMTVLFVSQLLLWVAAFAVLVKASASLGRLHRELDRVDGDEDA